MLRLMRKWETIKEYVPAPEIIDCGKRPTSPCCISVPARSPRARRWTIWPKRAIYLDAMRVRSFPFNEEVKHLSNSTSGFLSSSRTAMPNCAPC